MRLLEAASFCAIQRFSLAVLAVCCLFAKPGRRHLQKENIFFVEYAMEILTVLSPTSVLSTGATKSSTSLASPFSASPSHCHNCQEHQVMGGRVNRPDSHTRRLHCMACSLHGFTRFSAESKNHSCLFLRLGRFPYFSDVSCAHTSATRVRHGHWGAIRQAQ